MKLKYEKPISEINEFEAVEILTASSNEPTDDNPIPWDPNGASVVSDGYFTN